MRDPRRAAVVLHGDARELELGGPYDGVVTSPPYPGLIGYHEQHEDEVYYVLSGRGVMTLDDKPIDVGPGTAILTRPGSSHGLKQVGAEDLVILIAYELKP